MSRVISGQMNGKQDEENMVLRTLGKGFMTAINMERVIYIRFSRECRRIAKAVDVKPAWSAKSFERLIVKSINNSSIKLISLPTSMFLCSELFRSCKLSKLVGIMAGIIERDEVE